MHTGAFLQGKWYCHRHICFSESWSWERKLSWFHFSILKTELDSRNEMYALELKKWKKINIYPKDHEKEWLQNFSCKGGNLHDRNLADLSFEQWKKITHVLSAPCYLLYFLNKIGLLYWVWFKLSCSVITMYDFQTQMTKRDRMEGEM